MMLTTRTITLRVVQLHVSRNAQVGAPYAAVVPNVLVHRTRRQYGFRQAKVVGSEKLCTPGSLSGGSLLRGDLSLGVVIL